CRTDTGRAKGYRSRVLLGSIDNVVQGFEVRLFVDSEHRNIIDDRGDRGEIFQRVKAYFLYRWCKGYRRAGHKVEGIAIRLGVDDSLGPDGSTGATPVFHNYSFAEFVRKPLAK